MLKKYLLTIVFVSSLCYGYAQTDLTGTKKINHYIGVQANPLFRQLINLTNNNIDLITNPYLLTYSFVFAKSGWAIQAGVGYNYQMTADKDAPANHQSKMNNLSYRVGFGRKVMLSKRFEAEFALDFAGEYLNDKTFTQTVTNFGGGQSDSVATVVSSTTKSIGGGARGGLNFYLSPHVLLGTEASYYFMHSPQRQNVNVEETLTAPGSPKVVNSTNQNQSTNVSKFSLTLPAVLFLLVKF